MSNLRQQLSREWQLLLTDSWLLSLVSWVPLLLFFILWWIFSAGIPRDLTIGVVDLDNSHLSRALIREYDAHPSLRVSNHFKNISVGSIAMQKTDINALVFIPANLEKQMRLNNPPTITVFFNSQFLLTGNLIANAIRQAHGTYNSKLELVKSLANGKTIHQAFAVAIPLLTQITPLFNSNTNYAQFLVSAIIPAIWQILIVIISIMALARETRLQGIDEWLKEKPIIRIVGKLLPYTLILWLHGALFLLFMFSVLQWPMNGSWTILLMSQLLMVLASQAIALLVFLLVKDPTRALSLAAAYTAPSFAFMGVTFPATDMLIPAQIWRSILPVSHYIDIQINQANHGASLSNALPQMGTLMLFIPIFLLAYKLAIQNNKRVTIT